jgi:hypothetical protein
LIGLKDTQIAGKNIIPGHVCEVISGRD